MRSFNLAIVNIPYPGKNAFSDWLIVFSSRDFREDNSVNGFVVSVFKILVYTCLNIFPSANIMAERDEKRLATLLNSCRAGNSLDAAREDITGLIEDYFLSDQVISTLFFHAMGTLWELFQGQRHWENS